MIISESWDFALSIAFSAAGFYLAFNYIAKHRLMQDLPTAKIRSAPQSYVELSGVARSIENYEITSPISNTPCVWYRYEISRLNERDPVVFTDSSTELFALDDDTGLCVIDPEGLDITPTVVESWDGTADDFLKLPIPLDRYTTIKPNDKFHFEEKTIPVGSYLYALGNFRSVGCGKELFSLKKRTSQLVMEWSKDYRSLKKKFNLDIDAAITRQQWSRIHKAAQDEVRDKLMKRLGSTIKHTLSKPVKDWRPYMVTPEAEHQTVIAFKILAILSFIGFLAFGSYAIWITLPK